MKQTGHLEPFQSLFRHGKQRVAALPTANTGEPEIRPRLRLFVGAERRPATYFWRLKLAQKAFREVKPAGRVVCVGLFERPTTRRGSGRVGGRES